MLEVWRVAVRLVRLLNASVTWTSTVLNSPAPMSLAATEVDDVGAIAAVAVMA